MGPFVRRTAVHKRKPRRRNSPGLKVLLWGSNISRDLADNGFGLPVPYSQRSERPRRSRRSMTAPILRTQRDIDPVSRSASSAQLSFENQRAGSKSFGWLAGPGQKLLPPRGQRLPSRHCDHEPVQFAQHRAVDQRLLWQFLRRLVPRATLGGAGLDRVPDQPADVLTLARHELARVVAEELGTEVKCMNAGIIAFDYNEIFRAQEHVVFLDDLLFLHPACHTNALR